MISNQAISGIRNKLLEEKKNLQERIQGIEESELHESLSSSLSELSAYDNHPGDIGSEVFERSKDFALREKALITIKAIDIALARIDNGTYGSCEACGSEIPAERLEAVPYTTLCINCKKEVESKPLENSRPVEEAVMRDIYAKPYDDEQDSVEADWEDFFQEVADWNEHAARSVSGSYSGEGALVDEDGLGAVENVEDIAYEVGEDGVIYKDYNNNNGKGVPRENIKLGQKSTE